MKKSFLIALAGGVMAFSFSQKKDNTKSKAPQNLLSINGKSITTDEFKYTYEKNNGKNDGAYTQENINSYLELYKKFLVKVNEAEFLGFDTSVAFRKEFEQYKKQLTKPYLSSPGLADSLAKQAFERMKWQVNASHILVRIPSEDPKDTLEAYNKIVSIRKEILNGRSFADAAKQYSDDPSAKGEDGQLGAGGSLGYFSAFDMVYPFETAAYQTEIGKVSAPFKTRFGYHILKLNDKRENPGGVYVKHIMISAPDGMLKEDSVVAHQKINEIYQMVTSGNDWDLVCKQYSEHEQSKDKGGELAPFTLGGKLGVPTFEETAFALVNPGDISKPVKTPYGWHIIKLIEHQGLAAFDVMKADLVKKVSKDSRMSQDRDLLVRRLKADNQFKEIAKTKAKAWKLADSTLAQGTWKYDSTNKLLKKDLFTIKGQKYSVKNFFDFVVKTQRKRDTKDVSFILNQAFDSYTSNEVIAYEENHLGEKYPEYNNLVKEYHDGILLFDLMSKEVWNKALEDTTGLKEFFEQNKANYNWKDRAEAVVYNCASKETLNGVLKDHSSFTSDDLLKKYNTKSALELLIENNLVEKGVNKIIDQAKWQAGSVTEVEDNGRTYLVKIVSVKEGGPKKLSETKGQVISDYQNYLETKWVNSLLQKYPITINQEALNSLIKK